jgi:uncharacterized cupin superfamily protein
MNSISINDINYSEIYNFSRVGIHHITIEPGFRSSWPHAESLEEEFVYVLSGTVDCWINGYLHRLTPGFAVGFPAGTGIGHTFINNSSEKVELLVVGDRTLKENLCAFPVNPELKNSYGKDIWWEDYPKHPMGPHNGEPGPTKSDDFATEKPPFVINCFQLEIPKSSFHYAGDSETFGNGARLTTPMNLKNLGIWFERLPPGYRSSWPHAHTHEEEFGFIIEGELTAWQNGYETILKAGEHAAFPSNTGMSHCLINNSESESIYLSVGETKEFPDEKILYPLHPLRNKECARMNFLWKDPPSLPMGTNSAMPKRFHQDHLRLELCTGAHLGEIFKVYTSSPKYFMSVEGTLPTKDLVLKNLTDLPLKKLPELEKEFFLIQHNGEFIGVAELFHNHPNLGETYIGLLLLSEPLAGKGFGQRSFKLVEDYIKRAYKSKKIRIGVSQSNDVSGFWKKMGFQENGHSYTWGENKTSLVTEFEKSLK